MPSSSGVIRTRNKRPNPGTVVKFKSIETPVLGGRKCCSFRQEIKLSPRPNERDLHALARSKKKDEEAPSELSREINRYKSIPKLISSQDRRFGSEYERKATTKGGFLR